MPAGHVAWLTCACGHDVAIPLRTLKPEQLDEPGWTIKNEVLEKMRCSQCKRVGMPQYVRFGWSHVQG